jgi:hypothetical protein
MYSNTSATTTTTAAITTSTTSATSTTSTTIRSSAALKAMEFRWLQASSEQSLILNVGVFGLASGKTLF